MGLAFESMGTVNCPLQCRWASSYQLRAYIEQKVEAGGIHPFFFLPDYLSWDTDLFKPSALLVFRHPASVWNLTIVR